MSMHTYSNLKRSVSIICVLSVLVLTIWLARTGYQSTIQIPNLETASGQVFMIGHWADQPVASTTERIKNYQVGGVIIMSAPEDPNEIKTWITEWQAASIAPLLIAIDQEGGPVSRLRTEGFTTTSQREITSTTTAFTVGKARGSELAALGITLNFAPVVESAENPDSFMYDRVFPNKDTIADLAAALSDGLAEGGIIAVPKHFPGHADTPADSHNTLPSVPIHKNGVPAFTKSFADLIRSHQPQALMTAHVLYPHVDDLPATLSHYWLTNYLRDTLKFSGAIITDDMSMDAIDTTWPHEEASLLSLQAGADLILYAAEPEKVGSAIAHVDAARHDNELTEDDFTAKIERLQSLKLK